MTGAGYYLMHRGWMQNPVFKPEPYTEREAWLWLIENAAFQPSRARVSGIMFELNRGQLVASSRFLASHWRWSEPKVRRFILRLKTDAMIDARSDAGVTVISITNYDTYQHKSASIDAPRDALFDALPTQERRRSDAGATQERINDKEGNQRKNQSRSNLNGHAQDFDRWYAIYPKHVARGDAERAFPKALKLATIDQLIEGATRYAKQVAGKEPQYVAYPATWLNDKRWLDESGGSPGRVAEPCRPSGPPGSTTRSGLGLFDPESGKG